MHNLAGTIIKLTMSILEQILMWGANISENPMGQKFWYICPWGIKFEGVQIFCDRSKGEAYTGRDGTTAPVRATKALCSCYRGRFMKFNDTEKACLIDSFNHIEVKTFRIHTSMAWYLLNLLTGTGLEVAAGLEGNFPILIR